MSKKRKSIVLELIFCIYLWLRSRFTPPKCGYACDWVYPYGFVPEAGCPIHDKDESE